MGEEQFIVEYGIGHFPGLSKAGVVNACTVSQSQWGSMRVFNEGYEEKYMRFFQQAGVRSNQFMYMAVEHNDGIRILDSDNLKIYDLMTKGQEGELKRIDITADAIITSLAVPVVVTPADCAVIVVTGTDGRDEPFMAVIHCGFTGAMLQIVTRTVDTLIDQFEAEPALLVAGVFPYIAGIHYKKTTDDLRIKMVLESSDWDPYVHGLGDGTVGVDFGMKCVSELVQSGVENIFVSGKDVYAQAESGSLYSYSLARNNGEDKSDRFAVVAQLKQR